MREGREGVEEPCRGKQRSSCHNFHHYYVSFKMNNFRLLYPTNYACNSVSYLFSLVFVVVVVVFLFFYVARKL